MKNNMIIKLGRNRYRLLREITLNHTSYGEIWEAMNIDGELVAVKFSRQEAMESASKDCRNVWLDHLQEEIRFLSLLKHKETTHIVRLLDHGILDGLPVLVLELMHCNLHEWVRDRKNSEHPPDLLQIILWCRQIAQALCVVHKKGEHHRDLKLSNILIDKEGKRIKLADFGTVKINDFQGDHSYAGTPNFMAPEQALPHQQTPNISGGFSYHYDTDHRTDFFALGLILFTLVTGSAQLVSQYEIHKVRNTKGEQAAWKLRDTLGGLTDGDLRLFRSKLFELLITDNEATFLPEQETNPIQDKLASLLQKLCAKEKSDRPQHTDEIIKLIDDLLDILPTPPNHASTPPLAIDSVRLYPNARVRILISIALILLGLSSGWKIIDSKNHVSSTSISSNVTSYELPLDFNAENRVITPLSNIILNTISADSLAHERNITTTKKFTGKNSPVSRSSKLTNNQNETSVDSDTKQEQTQFKTFVYPPKPLSTHQNRVVNIPKSTSPEMDSMDTSDNRGPALQDVNKKKQVTEEIYKLPSFNTSSKPVKQPALKKPLKSAKSNHFKNLFLQSYNAPDMITIPGGNITMGRDDGPYDERPAHSVTIPSFAVSRFEITVGHYRQFCMDKLHTCPPEDLNNTLPVTNITRDTAISFVDWLSEKTGLKYRLPTESEWEYLAKSDFYREPQSSHQKLIPVTDTTKNKFGVYGLFGNAWELVSDCAHLSYQNAPSNGEHWGDENNGDCSHAVARGGSWFERLKDQNPTNRLIIPAKLCLHHVGFRVVLDANQENVSAY